MPHRHPHRRASLQGAIATATLPVITMAGITVMAAPAEAAPGPAGLAPTAKNMAAAKVRISAQIATTTAVRSGGLVVTVKSGDSVWALANRHGVSVASVLKLNKLSSSAIIHPGDKLVIKAGTASASTPKRTTSTKGSASSSSVKTSSARTHTIKAGDTLSGIAHRYGMSLSTLLKLNNVRASTVIYPGQSLKITGTATAAKPTTSGVKTSTGSTSVKASAKTHTVRSGDTLSGIAAKYKVSLNELLAANGLSRSSIIYIGRSLKLPAAASTPSTSTTSIPKTFLQYTYSDETNRSANANKALLNSRAVPSRAQMRQIVIAEAKRQGVNPSLAVAHATVESGLDARAVSPANALGVMQVMPSTGEWMSQRLGRKLNLLDPYDNVAAGVGYIAYLQSAAKNSNEGIAGYYAGLGGVAKRGITGDILDYVRKVRAAMG